MSPAAPRRRTAALAALAVALGACGSPAQTQSPAVATTASAEDPPDAAAPEACDAACLHDRADAARTAGIDDVAADHLGRAFALRRDEASLRAWVDALAQSGRRRAARAALAEVAAGPDASRLREATASLEREVAAHGPAGSDRPLAIADPPTAALSQALAAHARGDLDEARRAYAAALAAGPVPPRLLVGAGLLDARAGDHAAARRAWSRARIDLEERGGALSLVVADTWYTHGLLWRGEELLIVQRWNPNDAADPRRAEAITGWTASPSDQPLRELTFNAPSTSTAASADGRVLLRTVGDRLELVDAESGALLRSITAKGGELRDAISVGDRDHLSILVATSAGGELWRGDGGHVASFPLGGTTPTITRVYHAGRGTMHDNILNETPTWPVALALSADASVIAIGGSDSKVRLYSTRAGAKPRVLEYQWSYEERRHMGGNPDLNTPLAMRLVDGDAGLLVVYAHGDVIRWRVKDGTIERRLPGACSEAEAEAVVNRYRGPGEPRERPSDEAREGCGRAQRGVIAPDGRWVLTTSSGAGIRHRDLKTGAGKFITLDYEVPHDLVAISPSGQVAMSILYGHVVTWSPGGGLVPHHRGPEDTGPIEPQVSDSGQVLTFDLGRGFVHWDLLRGRDLAEGLAADESILAVADDGASSVIQRGRELLLRRDGAAPRVLEALAEKEHATARFAGRADRLILDIHDRSRVDGRRVVLHDLAGGGRTPLASPPAGVLTVSADGEAMTGASAQGTIEVLSTRDGKVLASVAADATAVVLAPDASFVAWLAKIDSPMAVARVQPLRGPGAKDPPIELRIPGWPKGLAISPDGEELLVITQQSITRWRGREGTATLLDERTYVIANQIHYSADGRHLFFENYGRVDVHRNVEGAPRVGAIVPLLTGGYLIQADDGAVDGSADAPRGVMTWVRGAGDEAMAAPGELAWDRFAEPGLYARLLRP